MRSPAGHAAYFGYEADDIHATGTIVSNEARIAKASARAYGAGVTLANSTISFDLPYRFRFAGHIHQDRSCATCRRAFRSLMSRAR